MAAWSAASGGSLIRAHSLAGVLESGELRVRDQNVGGSVASRRKKPGVGHPVGARLISFYAGSSLARVLLFRKRIRVVKYSIRKHGLTARDRLPLQVAVGTHWLRVPLKLIGS